MPPMKSAHGANGVKGRYDPATGSAHGRAVRAAPIRRIRPGANGLVSAVSARMGD